MAAKGFSGCYRTVTIISLQVTPEIASPCWCFKEERADVNMNIKTRELYNNRITQCCKQFEHHSYKTGKRPIITPRGPFQKFGILFLCQQYDPILSQNVTISSSGMILAHTTFHKDPHITFWGYVKKKAKIIESTLKMGPWDNENVDILYPDFHPDLPQSFFTTSFGQTLPI